MTLSSGTRLGPYEITHALGAGGMGEVYRARDSRLGRSVAIKVILDRFGVDTDRVARFEREAKVLASINHPNIAALYGMEEWNGQHVLIMELVEGETLAERLTRGPLEIEDALRIGLSIAEALEAAHERNIIHRDLKPANIKITPDDKVKVLDFGLAKTMDAQPARDVENSPTLSMMATSAGVILGTAAYMSPEQAKGFAADHRSDVFSFGVVLYEMLTGRRPFQGETAPDILASLLIREPELQRLPADLNPRVPDLLRRCLEKNPKRRWQAIGDLRAEIEAVMASPRAPAPHPVAAAPVKPLWRRALPAALTSIVAGLLTGAAVWLWKPAPPRETTRFALALTDGQALSGLGGNILAISPNGRSIAYTADGRIYVRSMSNLIATALPTPQSETNLVGVPAFSPDSQEVAFYSEDGTLRRIGIGGGVAITICPLRGRPSSLTWAGDQIFVATPAGLMRVPASGGVPETVGGLGRDERVQRVQLLPDGETLLLTIVPPGNTSDRWASAQIVAQSLKSGARTPLIGGASDGWYIPTGHLAYMIEGRLFAVGFDPARLELKGTAVPVVEGVRRASPTPSGFAWFGVADNGTLVYMPGPGSLTSAQIDVAIVERSGTMTTLKLPPAPYRYPRVSPDGKRIVLETDDGKEAVVRVHELSRAGAPQRLTFAGRNKFPIWTSDGSRVVFQSDRQGDLGMFWQAADGSRDAERLTTAAAGEGHIPESWHPGGGVLLYSVAKGNDYTLWTYSVNDKRTVPFGGVRSAIPIDALFSPDGKWVAYSSGTATDATIYVQPFPATGAKYELPRSGVPHHPLWTRDNTLIFNQRPGSLDVINVTTSPTLAFGSVLRSPRRFQTGPPAARRAFDIMPDGRLVGLAQPGDDNASALRQFMVVLNWFEELKSRVPR